MTILSLLKLPFNEGFSYLKYFYPVWLLEEERRTSAIPILLPALHLHLGRESCPRADSWVLSGEVLVLPLPEAVVDTT